MERGVINSVTKYLMGWGRELPRGLAKVSRDIFLFESIILCFGLIVTNWPLDRAMSPNDTRGMEGV